MRMNYRGFAIDLAVDGGWSARISNARTGKAWSRAATATLEEGGQHCMQKARNLIDTYIALNG